jgi:hypothetical protein
METMRKRAEIAGMELTRMRSLAAKKEWENLTRFNYNINYYSKE